ncbi:MAG TPA: beta-propeller fold lactonase family protein [Polyangiaceae bacterium]|nr:beta-propeller fold lactonase family protein [Polyangiaceae bacterium]
MGIAAAERASSRTKRACFARACAAVALLAFTGCRSHSNLVYVSTEEGNEVVSVDPVHAMVMAHIPVGKRPRAIKLSPDGKLLYVALSGSPRAGPGVDESKLPPADRKADGIGVVDLKESRLVRTLPSGADPESFDVSEDGKTLYVSNEDTAELTVLDLAAGSIKKKIPIGKEPEGVTLRPDGKFVYVTSEQDGALSVIDTATLTVTKTIAVGQRPRAIVFAADGNTAFVSNEFGRSVSVLDTRTNELKGTIEIPDDAAGVRQRPMGLALSPDAQRLYVTTGRAGAIAVIDVVKWTVLRRIEGVGARPWGIGVSRDGKQLFTANGPSDDLSIVNVATGKVENRVKVGKLPWGIAVSR